MVICKCSWGEGSKEKGAVDHVNADAIGGADEHADGDAMVDGDICKYPWCREQRNGLNGGWC